MNCPGGNVVSGIAVYNAMIAMPYPIVTHNIGDVDSIANVIFLGGNERYACPGSTFIFHGVGFSGNANERLEEINLRAKLDSILADHKRIAENGAILARSLFTPGAGFWINPLGADNLGGFRPEPYGQPSALSGIIPPRCYQRRIKREKPRRDWPPRRGFLGWVIRAS
jgi:hypothetical protein